MLARLTCLIPLLSSLAFAGTTLPARLGVNIHFTNPNKGEMEQLAAGGFSIVRMDFDWTRTEKQRGVYDWSEYETLLAALKPHGIGAIFIFDYANPLYDDNHSPDTEEGRRAFATWAAAAAKHFAGRGILWEMYNEPNIHPFWRPKPNPDDYVKLALETGKALRAAARDETFIGPACSGVDLPFLETCFKAGLLEYFSAVSVHPYRQHPPETVADDYRKLRLLIAKYAPKGKSIPIYSGECGYSSIWGGFDEEKQGRFLPRQWLTNIANDVPLSIWYDWHDDGPDAKEPEHHFGTVHLDYTPKPAYLAAQRLTKELAGFTFNKRLWLANDNDYLLMFTRADEVKLAAWTTQEPHEITLADGRSAPVTDEVQYFTAQNSEDLKKLVEWERAPLERLVKAPTEVAGTTLTRGQESLYQAVPGPDRRFIQNTMLIVSNPLRAALQPRGNEIRVVIDNPAGELFDGSLELHDPSGALVLRTPAYRVEPITPDFRLRAEGDTKIASTQSFDIKDGVITIKYAFDPGWKYICLQPKDPKALGGKPKSIGVWLTGDGSGNQLRARFVDSTGQTFQPDGPKLDFKDTRYVSFPLDGQQGGHWGGANDGVIHYPIKLETLLLIDSADRGKTSGTVTIESPTLIYEERTSALNSP